MRKGSTIAVLILVIIILLFIFASIVKIMTPVFIVLGLLILAVGALVWVIKSTFKKKDNSTTEN